MASLTLRAVTAMINSADIERAAARIERYVRRTPVIDLGDPFGDGYRLSLKLDCMQPTGSFKVRGAFSALTGLSVPSGGIVTASGGNFGVAVAFAAATQGHRATVFAPDSSPAEKIAGIGRHQAEVKLVPGFYREALQTAREWAAGSDALELHAYDQPEVVAGQGTCGMEITEQVPDSASIIVAVGGGGLIAGIAGWVRDTAKLVAVEPEACPTLHTARSSGGPVDVGVGGVAASSLGASRLGDIAWEANVFIDHSVLVPDDSILAARSWLWDTCRVLAEPAGAAPIAALLSGAHRPEPGERVVAVISGANTGSLPGQNGTGSSG